MEIIKRLQERDRPQIFTPRAAYDGRKNLFSIRELPFTEGTQTVRAVMDHRPIVVFTDHAVFQFDVTLSDGPPPGTTSSGKGPKVYKVKLTKVAEINPEYVRPD